MYFQAVPVLPLGELGGCLGHRPKGGRKNYQERNGLTQALFSRKRYVQVESEKCNLDH